MMCWFFSGHMVIIPYPHSHPMQISARTGKGAGLGYTASICSRSGFKAPTCLVISTGFIFHTVIGYLSGKQKALCKYMKFTSLNTI